MKQKIPYQLFLNIANLLTSCGLAILGSVLLGKYLDKMMKTDIVFTAAFSILGLIFAIYFIISSVMKLNK